MQHSENDLPPKPDSDTGRPRPPRAPVDAEITSSGRSTEKSQRYKPTPPPNHGPTLEWHKASRYYSILSGIIGAVIVAACGTLMFGGFEWTSIWWFWLFPLVTGLLTGMTLRHTSCAAGADWFKSRNDWVETYELKSVEVKVPANYRELIMKDKSGRQASIQLMTIQADRNLWDIVYNGILHSVVAGGAETNKLARKVLEIPDQPRDLPAEQA